MLIGVDSVGTQSRVRYILSMLLSSTQLKIERVSKNFQPIPIMNHYHGS